MYARMYVCIRSVENFKLKLLLSAQLTEAVLIKLMMMKGKIFAHIHQIGTMAHIPNLTKKLSKWANTFIVFLKSSRNMSLSSYMT